MNAGGKVDWRRQTALYLLDRDLKESTKSGYRLSLNKYLDWCATYGLEADEVQPLELQDYAEHLRRVPLAAATIEHEMRAVKLFYRWLHERQLIKSDPARDIRFSFQQPQVRPVPTVEQLRSMWSSDLSALNRVIVGLMAIGGMKPREIVAADVLDLGRAEGVEILRVAGRRRPGEAPYVVLHASVAAAIHEYIGERNDGPLLLTSVGRRFTIAPLTRRVDRIGKDAKLPFKLFPLTLSFTLRAIAIEQGFAYPSVIRSVGEMETRRLAEWVSRAPANMDDHASLRLARLITLDQSSPEVRLGQASDALKHSEGPPAVAAAYAGAILERHLRGTCLRLEIPVRAENGKLSTYAAQLKARSMITTADIQIINRIQIIRDDAAHGWFEKVGNDEASWLIREAQSLIARMP
ncbi:hypothetical protein GCM10010988_17540 [Cnuibacter physcomitrellae]|uniref:Uncharacterized protein n=1 Tax=Cnuibacter physcomitrellae TaxID=1619308 RepID=A0A1X9LPW2_9MICO|nr:phage integrase N-terminal SAM-like domain-containing protein [Cnuibacter physcomitrellae]ARJ06492.1 hypothetical protein B5808_15665 [Cnuibacter physcomitrellae]GGI38147.1 hypothetical protein GCM10010988_17540 [Cnuibacter physcomitrellae]